MKFLLDENFPKSSETLLTELGRQVIDIRGSEFQGADDVSLFDIAQEDGAVPVRSAASF